MQGFVVLFVATTFLSSVGMLALSAPESFNEFTAQAASSASQRPSCAITASTRTVVKGDSVTLSWKSTNATTARRNGTTVPVEGSVTDSPTRNKTYKVEVRNSQGRRGTCSVSLRVVAGSRPAIRQFQASETTVRVGVPIELSWETANATSCTLSGIPTVDGRTVFRDTVTSHVITPALDSGVQTYTLTCSGFALGDGSIASTTKSLQITRDNTLAPRGSRSVGVGESSTEQEEASCEAGSICGGGSTSGGGGGSSGHSLGELFYDEVTHSYFYRDENTSPAEQRGLWENCQNGRCDDTTSGS